MRHVDLKRWLAAMTASVVALGCQAAPPPTEPSLPQTPQTVAPRTVLQAPGNDDFDTPTFIEALPFVDTLNTFEATTADDDPDSCGQGPTVWYRFTPTADQEMLVTANTFGSAYDTTLSLYTGERGNLVQLECNDDDNFTSQSRIRFFAQAGTTYHIMVGSFNNQAGGDLTFTMQVPPPPLTIDSVTIDSATVVPSTGVVTLAGTVKTSTTADGHLSAQVEQRSGRFLFSSSRSLPYHTEDDTLVPWSMTIEPQNGKFSAGTASVRLSVSASNSEEFVQEDRVLSVQLQATSLPRIERVRVSRDQLAAGLHASFFSIPPNTSALPDLGTLVPRGMYIASTIDVPNASCTVPFQEVVDEDGEWYAVRYIGILEVATAGTTRFTLASDDGSKLYLGGQLMIDNDGLHGFEARSAEVSLNRGFYEIRVDFFQGPCGDRGLQLFWTPSGGTRQIIPPEALHHLRQ